MELEVELEVALEAELAGLGLVLVPVAADSSRGSLAISVVSRPAPSATERTP